MLGRRTRVTACLCCVWRGYCAFLAPCNNNTLPKCPTSYALWVGDFAVRENIQCDYLSYSLRQEICLNLNTFLCVNLKCPEYDAYQITLFYIRNRSIPSHCISGLTNSLFHGVIQTDINAASSIV